MALTQEKRVAIWQKRVDEASDRYEDWEAQYRCEECEEFYYGHQRENDEDYVINLILPTIEVKIPSLFFSRPSVKVEPRITRIDDPNSEAVQRAKLQEDTVNTMLGDRRVRFKEEASLALKEAFFRFGILEVGYTADWIDNPNAGKPILKEDNNPLLDEREQPIFEPEILLRSERLYCKRIPARNWRVSSIHKNSLYQCDWCGYCEWHYPEDIKRNKLYKNTGDIKANSALIDSRPDAAEDPEEKEARRGMVKIWKIWDLRTMQRFVWVDGAKKFLMEGKPFTFLPFADIKFIEKLDSWYPVPPVFNWLSPQKELNEVRDAQRTHRRRFKRRYTAEESVEDSELKKLQGDEDGTVIKARAGAIEPIKDAPLDQSFALAIPDSKTDLREISSTGGEQRGVQESKTATQASIIDTRAQIRESYSRTQVADFVAHVGLLVLMTIREKMALPFWIKVNVDPLSQGALKEAAEVTYLYRQISSDELGDLNLDLTVDAEQLSPLTKEQEKADFFQGLAVLTHPQIGSLLTFSDVLFRKAMRFFGVKSGLELEEIRKALQLSMVMAMQARTAMAGGGAGGGASSALPASPSATLPSGTDIARQIAEQMGGITQ